MDSINGQQDGKGTSTPIPEVREGSTTAAGTIAGDNTDAGRERDDDFARSSEIPNSGDLEKHDLEKCNGGGKSRDHSRESSQSPSEPCEPPPGEQIIVSFSRGDPENPYNWANAKKLYVTFTCIGLIMNSTIGSGLPAGDDRPTSEHFNVYSSYLLVLPVSMYLLGYVLGPLFFGPISETLGRRKILIATFLVYTAFTLGCALAPTYTGFVIMRLLCGIGASTPISVIGGVYADIFSSAKTRGRAMSTFMLSTMWGPILGPIISGFLSPVSWRWPYWGGLIIAGATWPFVLVMPETYGPVLLKRKAQRLRKRTGDDNIVAPVELQKQDWKEFVTKVLTRPVRMFLFEPIVLFSCLYLSLVYAIFYMFFQAFPIIYQGVYHFNAGEEGLAFPPIGIGSLVAGAIYLYWEHYLEKARKRESPPAWSFQEEYFRLPPGLLAAPLFALSLFWLGWTARPDIHWIAPVLSAIPFGIGYLLVFMSLINYIVDAYEVYAASAMGAASCSRSLFGVAIPVATTPMYDNLGIGWACSLLGFISIAMGLVPFAFFKYGDYIRAHSKFCQQLKREKAEEEEKEREREEREERLPQEPEKKV